MAAVSFPSIRPTSRRYSPGEYPQRQFQAQNGSVTTLRYGNKRSEASLELTFSNISDANAVLILQNYEAVTVADDWVTFTATDAAAGASTTLGNYFRETEVNSGLHWRYAEPPNIESVRPGLSTVSVKFVGQLDGV